MQPALENSIGESKMAAIDSSPLQRKPGEAWIKAEFIIPDHQRVLSVQYISKMDQIKQLGDVVADGINQGNDGESGRKRSSDDQWSLSGKKIKLKGKNRSRSRHQTQLCKDKDKICPSILHERKCPYADRGSCKFSHDVAEFIAQKPPDLGERCHLFETLGRCPYGIACRFSSQHVSEYKNIVNEELYEKTKQNQTVLNTLERDVQYSLWKHKYDFSLSASVMRKVQMAAQARVEAEKLLKGGSNNFIGDKALEELGSVNRLIVASSAAEPIAVAESSTVTDTTGDQVDLTAENPALNDRQSDTRINKEEVVCVPVGSGDACSKPNGDMTVMNTQDVHHESKGIGCVTDEDTILLKPREKKKINFRDKLYLAPLTTVGNMPFRRICKRFGADITCSEMARSTALLQGSMNEWALMKRHSCEDLFGVQVCGAQAPILTKCAQLLNETISLDFMDINCGCPIDYIFNHGEGCALMGRSGKFQQIVEGMTSVLNVPLTVKLRTGICVGKNTAHTLISRLRDWGVSLVTIHGRSREQRYTRLADWDYISECAKLASPMPVFGNGDILSYEDYELQRQQTDVSGIMIARGALIKPWIFTEIKERRHWDISASERFDILSDFVKFGLEHWGSDQHGVDHTRRFLMEMLSFSYRYIPVGLLERLPQRINERPPYYRGRNDLETLMSSANCADWVKISEMLLGPIPDGFVFLPKHKANAFQ